MIKAVLFDVNGVIVDDEPVHELAFREAVKPYGIKLSHTDYLACCAGKTDKDGFEAIANKFSKELPIQTLLRFKSQKYLKFFPKNKKAYPGVLELIETLKHEFRLALTSSSARREVELITNSFRIRNAFEVLVSGDDVASGKPDPEPYLLTTRLLNLSPYECVVIEDSASGVASAKSAGCYCIGVSTTHTAKDLSGADMVVYEFDKITGKLIRSL